MKFRIVFAEKPLKARTDSARFFSKKTRKVCSPDSLACRDAFSSDSPENRG
jgi:hypothetical protein